MHMTQYIFGLLEMGGIVIPRSACIYIVNYMEAHVSSNTLPELMVSGVGHSILLEDFPATFFPSVT